MEFNQGDATSYLLRIEERLEEVEEALEHIPDGQKNPVAENMKIHSAKEYRLAIVFIDINDFTGYLRRNGKYETAVMLNILNPIVIEVANYYDGFFEKNTGDGILAYFGAGKSDPRSTCLVAEFLAVIRWMVREVINDELTDHGYEAISISAGVDYGDSYVSRVGTSSTKNQQLNQITVISDAANIASKLESDAKDSEFVLGSGFESNHRDDCGWKDFVRYRGTVGGRSTYQYSAILDPFGTR
jgi:class 3 adenylate cyclase